MNHARYSFVLTLGALAAAGALAQGTGKPNDAQIAGIVVAANTIDIDAGKTALKQSKTPEVQEFANLMIKDHTAVNKNATDLVTRLGVKPEDSDTAKSLKSAADAEQKKLSGLTGSAFDHEYLSNEVTYHRNVLDAIKDTLIPSAQNAELKKMLVDVTPAFQAHLDHAEQSLKALDAKR